MSRATKDMTFLMCVALLSLAPLIIGLNALATMKLWDWFIVPIGARSIVWQQAVGIGLLVSVLNYRYRKFEATDLGDKVFSALFSPVFAIGTGWLLSGFAR